MARTTADLRVDRESIEVVCFPEMIGGGLYPAPVRFGRPSRPSSHDPDGYSDHFPVAIKLRERT